MLHNYILTLCKDKHQIKKSFYYFLNSKVKQEKKITADNIDEAIQYVLKNYKDGDIPTHSELRQLARQLVLRYMQIPLLRRTRDVLKNTYGRALANFEKPKALTEAGKEVQKKTTRFNGESFFYFWCFSCCCSCCSCF